MIDTFVGLEKAIKEQHILRKYKLNRIGVFGSFARGEQFRDIDVFIDSETYQLKNLIGLKRDLEKITQKDVDIMLKKYANPIVLYRAQRDMKYVAE
jgi:predicted nucleotidyltransferase